MNVSSVKSMIEGMLSFGYLGEGPDLSDMTPFEIYALGRKDGIKSVLDGIKEYEMDEY